MCIPCGAFPCVHCIVPNGALPNPRSKPVDATSVYGHMIDVRMGRGSGDQRYRHAASQNPPAPVVVCSVPGPWLLRPCIAVECTRKQPKAKHLAQVNPSLGKGNAVRKAVAPEEGIIPVEARHL